MYKIISLPLLICCFSLILQPLSAESWENSTKSNAINHNDISSSSAAQVIYTPYSDEPKALFEFFFDQPEKIYGALFWIRSYMNTLMAEPYAVAPEFMHIIVIIHGTEIVTLAKKNYAKYKNAVDRMDYYQQLGVEFRVCMDAADDYGYTPADFHSFVKVVPSAMVELGHWQTQGYPLIRPLVFEKRFSIEDIR